MRVTLTREYRKIATTYGLFQNLSGDANIELTEDVQSDGIVLRPFQIVAVNRTVYARKVSGAGTAALAVLPFVDAEETDGTDDESSSDTADETNSALPSYNPPPPKPPAPPRPPHHDPYDCFCREDFPKPPPPPHGDWHHGHRPPPPDNDADKYVIKIPRELVDRGQNKFVVDFSR